jgi:hypothetical protein
MKELTHRRALLTRLLQATGAGSLGACLAGTMGTACASKIAIDASGSTTTGHGGASTTSSVSAGGAGGATGVGGAGGATGAGGSPGDAGLCGPVQMCFSPGDAGLCPAPASLVGMTAYLTACPGAPGTCPRIAQVLSGPFVDGGTECCYFVEGTPIPCYVGRTFFLDEGVVKAELRPGRGWRQGPRPEVDALPAETRRALGEAWARDGLFEHASVASFSRFSMQLLALGAPADLVRDTHAACVDEVRHAELCFALASAYLGHDVEPSGLPMPAAVGIDADLAAVAAESALEGCVGETVAAVQAYVSLLRATDPAVREVLAMTVEDETRHAELAWRFLAWTLDTGGPDVRERVMRAFAGFRPARPTPENLDGVEVTLFEAHGRMVAGDARAIADQALADVVRPCLCALLERRKSTRTSALQSQAGAWLQ